jgi:hypothetical protein
MMERVNALGNILGNSTPSMEVSGIIIRVSGVRVPPPLPGCRHVCLASEAGGVGVVRYVSYVL